MPKNKPITKQPKSYGSLSNYEKEQQAVVPVKAHSTIEINCNNWICCSLNKDKEEASFRP